MIVVAPLFLAAASVFNGIATNDAASEFVAGRGVADLTVKEALDDCRDELQDSDLASLRDEYGVDGKGGDGEAEILRSCAATRVADDRAVNAVNEASTRDLATGFSYAGRLGLAFALIYCCLYGMRTGLLTRFWGSLGMALGAAALLLLIQFTLIWFLYFALLLAGWVPGGRPPAWAAGKAIPWPTPGEKASAELKSSPESDEDTSADESGGDLDSPDGGERRKRKQRD